MASLTKTMRRIDDADLDVYQYRMLMHIFRVGQSWETLETLSEKCNMSLGKASGVRNWLVKEGWLAWGRARNGKMALSVVSPHEEIQQNISPHETEISPHETEISPHENPTIKSTSLSMPNEEAPPSPNGNGLWQEGETEGAELYDPPKPNQAEQLEADWLALVGKTQATYGDTRETDYLEPARILLERCAGDMSRAWELLKTKRQDMLSDNKTPFRIAAVVPAIFADLDKAPVAMGYEPNEDGVY
jgi:hypothetical protein